MNFLKRAGAIFMLLAIFASSCNKYADDFDQVNTKLDAIATSVAGLSTLTTDMSAIKSQITALQTSVAALPTSTTQAAQFAAVAAELTKMSTAIASLDTQIKAVATTGTATKTAVDKLAVDLKALSDKVAADNTKILAGQADAMTKLNAMDNKLTNLDSKMIEMQKSMVALADAVAKVQAGTDANTLGIAKLATDLTAQAAEIAKIGTDLTANSTAATAANDAAVAAATADAAANATLMADQAKIAADVTKILADLALAAQTGATGDAVTALTIGGLQAQLNAQKAQLDLIIANTALKVTDVTIAGTLNVGGILTASPVPSSATVTYQWQTATTAGGTYADIAGATTNKYTVVAGDLNNFFKVKVTGTGSYANSSATSTATAAVGASIAMVSVGTPVVNTAGDPFPQVGKKIKAGTLNPSAATVNWQWQSSTALTGVYTDIAGATSSSYTPVLADANMYIRVVATGKEAYTGVVTSGSAGPFLAAAVTSPNFTAVAGNNLVTITLADGSFKAAPITAADFVWTGVDAANLATAVYTRVSATVVTAQLGGATTLTVGGLNNVGVLSATLATASTGVTAAASTAIAVNAPLVAPAYAFVAGDNTVTVTLTGATFKAGTIAATDFTIGGPDAALLTAGTFTRTSNTVVTIRTSVPSAGTAANTLTVNSGTIASEAVGATVAAVASTVAASAVLSPAFSLVAGNNSVMVTLTGGTFAAGIVQANLTWAGTDAAALGAATLTYVDATHIVVTGIAGLVGVNNTVTVAPAGISTFPGVLGVSCAGVTQPNIVSAVFSSTAGHTKVTITLGGGGMWKSAGIVAADFNFSGNPANAALFAAGAFVRTSNTVVTVTTAALGAAANNQITVLPTAYAAGTSAAGATAP